MEAPYQAYYRVWIAFGQTAAEHEKFHSSLWSGNTESRVVRLLVARVSESPADDRDREAVIAHIHEDWQNARVLASMASSTTCWGDEDFAAKLAALREQSTYTVEELAKRAGLSRHAIYAYEQGKRRPTWAAVQALANALGISTDTFRDS